MKKLTVLLIPLVLAMILASCGMVDQGDIGKEGSPQLHAKAILNAKVMKVYDESILVAKVGEEVHPADLYMISSQVKVIGDGELNAGAIIEVGYDGAVQEIFPARLGSVQYVKVIEQQDDLVGLYESAFTDLLEVDKGLNENIRMLAFDLSKAGNLTEAEKQALVYVLGNKMGLETVTGTFDELCEDGYIDQDKLVLDDGILLKLEVDEIGEKSFKFNAEKWRSGLGAYYFHECTAKKTNNRWEYSIGAEMIS